MLKQITKNKFILIWTCDVSVEQITKNYSSLAIFKYGILKIARFSVAKDTNTMFVRRVALQVHSWRSRHDACFARKIAPKKNYSCKTTRELKNCRSRQPNAVMAQMQRRHQNCFLVSAGTICTKNKKKSLSRYAGVQLQWRLIVHRRRSRAAKLLVEK